MTFVKVVKNKSYFKRFQVQFRRRREGKTDYYARKRLIVQDKTKYNALKYRFVVRFTNKDIITQIVASKIRGDEVVCSAYAHELPRYGLKVGLTNYSAAYCTGLLCARRLLQKFKLDKKYLGQTKVDGAQYLVSEPESGPRPFKAALDVGLARTTTGANIFGCLKGACDGGLHVPHSEEGKRFPGYKDGKYDPKVHRAKIFGGPVSTYMKTLKEKDPKKYSTLFSEYVKAKIEPGDIEKLYTSVHANIRADPSPSKKKESKVVSEKDLKKRPSKKTLVQRRKDIKTKKEALLKEISKKRAEAGFVPKEEDVGVVKMSKKDKTKQISTKKPKAAKGAEAKGKDAKGGAKDAKGGAKDAKGGAKTETKPGAKTEAKPEAKSKGK